jgi:methyl-accepting chemotaxis protein
MGKTWTFGQKVGAGFAAIVALTLALGVFAIYSLREVVASKDGVIDGAAARLIQASELRALLERKGSAGRGFLISADARHLDDMGGAREAFVEGLAALTRGSATDDERRLVKAIERSEAAHQAVFDEVTAARRTTMDLEAVSRVFDAKILPRRDAVDADIETFVAATRTALQDATRASSEAAAQAINLVIVIVVGVVVLAIVVAVALARGLTGQIGAAVGHVQSSSAELQAAAHQQATGAKEQATAMNEITTTINELLATARQIAEGSQRVAQIADQTATAARSGGGTVEEAHQSIAGIRRQVDLVVGHALELGTKSQQIGSIVDIVSELAEQTNILAINASIEAAGAGEAGKRFAVVADEIRKLADRVSGSTKEIRTLIDDVRSAVNTTVMATELGSKAVDTGARQFGDVAATFQRIAGLVTTTTEAAREIELSTKQQTSAVEQVNLAIANVAQATKETETSSGQTLQTASQLATLSKDLLGIVQARAAV